MSEEAVVDLGLFRLRAFEREWLGEITTSPGSSELGSVGNHMLNAALILEGKRWLELGREIGYFSGRSSVEFPETDLVDEKELYLVDKEELFRSGIPYRNLEPAAFGEELVGSTLALTPERREFLRMVFFSDEEEWERGLQLVQIFIGAIREGPWQSTEETLLRDVSWALAGAESERAYGKSTPANWREVDAPFWSFRGPPRARARWEAIRTNRYRALIALQAAEDARSVGFPAAAEHIARPIEPPTD
jgi:hypothetical protein